MNYLQKLHKQLLNHYFNTPLKQNNNLQYIKDDAIEHFEKNFFPLTNIEKWKRTDLSKIINTDYHIFTEELISSKEDFLNKNFFHCEIQNLQTYPFILYNGFFVENKNTFFNLPKNIIICSFKKALLEYPSLIEKYFNKSFSDYENGLISLNTALATDGIFIYIPDKICIDKPIQLIDIVDSEENLFLQTRNLIILGKNSEITFLQCDDSLKEKNSFKNSITEFYLLEGSKLNHYKLQNKHKASTLINTIFFNINQNSQLFSNTITFNCGNIRNEYLINLNEINASADIYGLYLLDREQHLDNYIFVRHNAGSCHSSQNFKGILDDSATASFTGYVYVNKFATKTKAFQSNKNILLTDSASAYSQPFLEIYNDDVECRHSATTGQLDPDALFYLRSRGICERNARLILMYAFANEIINFIKIESLKKRIEYLVEKRLKGELQSCNQCLLHCSPIDTVDYFFKV